MDPESVTLVFASYFLNNPSSMYGHTFLRLNRKGDNHHQPLLDYTVNFAAYPTTYNPILYVIDGLSSGYAGLFSTMPWLVLHEGPAVQQFGIPRFVGIPIDADARTDYSYGSASMGSRARPDAYYFPEELRLSVASILEVANPDLHMSDAFHFKRFPWIRCARSSATGSGFKSHGAALAREPDAGRPRVFVVGSTDLGGTIGAEIGCGGDGGAQKWPPDQQAKILDSAYNLFRYQTGFAREQPPAVAKPGTAIVLVLRIELGSEPYALAPASSTAPSTGPVDLQFSPDQEHPTASQLGLQLDQAHSFEELSGRAAFMTRANDPRGYIRGQSARDVPSAPALRSACALSARTHPGPHSFVVPD